MLHEMKSDQVSMMGFQIGEPSNINNFIWVFIQLPRLFQGKFHQITMQT